ncbi:MAG: AsmA-like C-terminal region-containing protein, partial [Xanthomonadales bacterium]|nr:AsmA-like C-terminal region-containing protein [Xanthomonadales bacterium]
GAERVLECSVDDRLAMAFDLPEDAESPRSAAFRLGARHVSLPGPGLLRVAGRAGRLDLDGWLDIVIDAAVSGRGLGGLALEPARLQARDLVFLDREFGEVGMEFRAEDADIRGVFEGEDIDGKVRFTAGAGGMSSLSAEFERLALGDPLSSGVDMDTDPADLPALHLYAESLRYAGIELGETRIEAYPIANGFHFEKVEAASDRLSLQAKGDWLLDDQGHRSDFDIRMASESLGDFLQSMDIASPVQGGQTLVYFNAWWPGSPAAFGLSRLNGEVEFSVVDGNIANASAGTGRLLGLLSVQALPKRLALDFRDVFDAGFSFDEASGSFAMQNGTATTDNVLLRSSSANISVSGRTDLVSREYDQLMTIRPGVGNTLPIIGALAAGPGGAAAGLALQGLLHGSLAEATQVRYSITGSWEDPRIEAVEVERQDG